MIWGRQMSEQFKGRKYKSAAELGHVRPAKITRIEPPIIEPEPSRIVQHSKPTVMGSHTDRAVGFRIALMPLASGFSLSAVISLIALGVVPAFSMAALAVMFVTFSITWLGGFVVNQLVSPDGVGLASEYWRHQRLRDNQKFVQEQFKEQYRNE